jgi:hypothetical protein
MTIILILLVLGGLAYLLYRHRQSQISSVGNAQVHSFENFHFSTKEFYEIIEKLIKEKGVPDLKCLRVNHSMRGLLSAKREYLRVQYQEFFFDICAAPFGKDFFLSWHQGTLVQVTINKRDMQTFYEQDTEAMFNATVKYCLDAAMKQVAESKGLRTTEGQEVVQLYN